MSVVEEQEQTGSKGVFWDFINYAQDGYQSPVSFIFSMAGLSAAIFSAFRVVGLLSWLSPYEFEGLVFLIGLPSLAGWGWIWQKKLHGYRRGLKISVESSPYTQWKLTPKEIPLWTAVALMLENDERPKVRAISQQAKKLLKRNGIELE